MIAWVDGAGDVTDPRIAGALADALGRLPAGTDPTRPGSGVTELHLGAAPAGLRPAAVGVAGEVRVVVGHRDEAAGELVLEANVDDLDPRLWPGVLAALLAAGANDAWLTPMLMKKGRPAHTVAALVGARAAPAVRAVLLTETTTIGIRATAVSRTVADRREETVRVAGAEVRVKVAHADGVTVNVMPEWEDVAAAAALLGRPAKEVLARAHAAAAHLWDDPGAGALPPGS